MLYYRVDIAAASLCFLCSSSSSSSKHAHNAHYQRIWVIAPEKEVTKQGRSNRLAEETGGSSKVRSALQPFPLQPGSASEPIRERKVERKPNRLKRTTALRPAPALPKAVTTHRWHTAAGPSTFTSVELSVAIPSRCPRTRTKSWCSWQRLPFIRHFCGNRVGLFFLFSLHVNGGITNAAGSDK